jgi:hypothetical protein
MKKPINEFVAPPSFKGYIQDRIDNDPDTILDKMRKRDIPVEHTMFATIHHQSDERPDGYTPEELEEIANNLHGQDVERWKALLDNPNAAEEDDNGDKDEDTHSG